MDSHITRSSSDPLSKAFIPDSSKTASGETTIAPQPTHVRASKEVIPSDLQVLEGIDILDQESVTQKFLSTQQWSPSSKGGYQADLRYPKLEEVRSELLMDQEPPFETDAQKAVKHFFRDIVRKKLKKEAQQGSIASATASTTTHEAPLKKGIKKEATDKGVAPKEQSTKGTEEREEESGPELPLPQLEIEVNFIVNSVTTGKIEVLSESQKKLTAEATKETQKKWGLPASWSVGSDQALDWTPVKKVDPPINIERARKETIAENLGELLEAFQKAGQKVMNWFPPDNPQRIAVGDVIQVISKAIRDLKEILKDLQMKDSDIAIKISSAKFESIKERSDEVDKLHIKNQEAFAARASQEEMSKTMRTISCVVSIFATLIGALLVPFTAGVSTALIISAFAVAASMTTYTLLDMNLNITQSIMTGVSDWLNGLFPGDENNWKRVLIKTLIVSTIVAILAVAIVFTGGGAAASVATQTVANAATQTAAQIAKQALMETVKQLSIQAIMITVMSSNVIPELFSTALIESGVLNRNNKEGKKWSEIAMMALTMLSVMTIVATGGKDIGSALKGIGKGIVGGAQSFGRSVINTANALLNAIKSLQEGIGAATEGIKQMLELLTKMLKTIIEGIKNTPKDIAMGTVSILKDLKEGIMNPKDNFMKIIPNLAVIFKLAGISTEIVSGCMVGAIGMDLSRLLKEIGELEKEQEIIQLLIKLFDRLLKNVQDDVSKISDWLKSLDQAMDSTLASANQILSRAS